MIQAFNGVDHDVLPDDAIDYHAADRRVEGRHPLGDVFVLGAYGHVAVGLDWFRFPIAQLARIAAYKEPTR